MTEQPDNPKPSIHTAGGPAIEGNVNVERGDFVGRDQFNIGTFINTLIKGDSEDVRKLRNRQAMLKLVHDTWVKGVLEQSLHGVAALELGLETRPDAVDHPWEMTVQMPEQPVRRFAPGTTVSGNAKLPKNGEIKFPR